MPTPTTAFADAAAKYGDVDPNDIEAVQRWFAEELLKLSPEVIERVLHDLLQRDGEAPEREMIPSIQSAFRCRPWVQAPRWLRHCSLKSGSGLSLGFSLRCESVSVGTRPLQNRHNSKYLHPVPREVID